MTRTETWPRERPKGTRMGRGHYKLIAQALRESRLKGHGLSSASAKYIRGQWLTTCGKMADALAVTNPSFRRETFLAACGVSDE